MAGYNFGPKAVFGSGNTTVDLTGPTVVVGDDNTVSGSSRRNFIGGSGNTIHEDVFDVTLIGAKNSQIKSGSTRCAVIGGTGSQIYQGTSNGVILGGILNGMSAIGTMSHSVQLGGLLNNINGGTSVVVGGQQNVVGAADYAAVIGSGNNVGLSVSKAWCFGASNTIGDSNFRIGFLSWNGSGSADAGYNLATGYYPFASIHSSRVHGGGRLSSTDGSIQFHELLVACQTTNATETLMQTQVPGAETSVKVRANSSFMFKAEIVARRTGTQTESAAYEIVGCIKNDAGTTALQGTITKTVIAEADANWDVTAVANNTDDTLDIKVTGAAGKNINWVAKVSIVETNGA